MLSIEKDKTIRLNYLKNESKRKVLKAISQNTNLPLSIRLQANLHLSELPKNSSPSRIKNRCILSGRGRFLIGKYKLSRLMLRYLARNGVVPGLRKSSW